MSELKVYLSKNVNERFRRMAMSVYGYGRGSLSKAAEEALERWCAEQSEHPNADIVGRSADVQHGSVKETPPGINPDERQRNSPEPRAVPEDNSSEQGRVGPLASRATFRARELGHIY